MTSFDLRDGKVKYWVVKDIWRVVFGLFENTSQNSSNVHEESHNYLIIECLINYAVCIVYRNECFVILKEFGRNWLSHTLKG
jgi:hypothetical protein